ncbi:hypothetical protein AWV63_08535 [Micromonospora rifamycinica]|uniref:Uncharacterized protein n=1 Tax=Micromonospora rifamycinica TaxID=291594 RepID=A0A109IMC4_9ACTN|nr:hypothetical protein AWV63_08535 [Micromonospora rifamycinica]SCG51022.1 hypothetical protein GA0070623_1879 [Micromonospora rifamycinica]
MVPGLTGPSAVGPAATAGPTVVDRASRRTGEPGPAAPVRGRSPGGTRDLRAYPRGGGQAGRTATIAYGVVGVGVVVNRAFGR